MTIANPSLSFDGTDLMTLAYKVRALGLDESLPGRRGENVIVPGVAGQTYVAKELEQRTIDMLMWVAAVGTAGSAQWAASSMGDNINTLTALFGSDGTHTITRTRGTTALTGTVEVRDVRFTPGGAYHYDVAVSMVMPDPLWYATSATTASTGFSSVPASPLAVVNGGTYVARNMTVTLACPASPAASLTNPKVTIGSFWAKYTGVIAPGQSLVIQPHLFAATYAGNSVVSDMSWNESNGPVWLELARGSNNVVVSADGISNTPTITVSFYAPYL